jgi:3',5'-cyclic AMP phosphodiesterase CpdA
MKRVLLYLSVFSVFFLFGCRGALNMDRYTDDEPIFLTMASESLNILQLTDLHLNNRFDPDDHLTFQTISELVRSRDWDLVIITGDLFLSTSAPSQMKRLVDHMESLATPWTFVFGNHETDFSTYAALLDAIGETEWLRFKVGPDLGDGACGVFRMIFLWEDQPFYTLYLMDSHPEDDQGRHGFISIEQVAWYESHVQEETHPSLVFTHIPLIQFEEAETYEGVFNEPRVFSQDQETGLFDAMVRQGKTVGFFCGHDHLNDFRFDRDGVCFAYGRVTGHNDYGDLEKGGRAIEIDATGTMTTYILLQKELN